MKSARQWLVAIAAAGSLAWMASGGLKPTQPPAQPNVTPAPKKPAPQPPRPRKPRCPN